MIEHGQVAHLCYIKLTHTTAHIVMSALSKITEYGKDVQ